MDNSYYNNLKTGLQSSRKLEKDSDFDFFEKLIDEQNNLTYTTQVLKKLFYGLYDDSTYPVLTSNLLDLIRSFENILKTENYVKSLFENCNIMLPHAKYWLSLLLMDVLKMSNYTILVNNIKLLSKNKQIILKEQLILLKNDTDWNGDAGMVETIDKLIELDLF